MSLRMHTHTSLHMHTHVFTYAHTHTHLHISTHTNCCTHTHTHTHTHYLHPKKWRSVTYPKASAHWYNFSKVSSTFISSSKFRSERTLTNLYLGVRLATWREKFFYKILKSLLLTELLGKMTTEITFANLYLCVRPTTWREASVSLRHPRSTRALREHDLKIWYMNIYVYTYICTCVYACICIYM